MHKKVEFYLDQAMNALGSNDEVLQRLIAARKTYELLTGKIDEDHEECELRLLSFNEWFLFDFIDKNRQVPFIIEFLNSLNESVEEIKELFSNVRYSFFECQKKKFSSKLLLKDFVNGKKYVIHPKNFPADLVSPEIFTGRMLNVEGEVFLFKGIRWLPKQIQTIAVKRAKKVKKLGNPYEEKKFTLNLELTATKCIQFKHVDPVEIFISLIS